MYDDVYSDVEIILHKWLTHYSRITSESEKKNAYPAVEKILKAFRIFFNVIDTCKITVGKPRVNKVKGAWKNTWYFEKDRLFVLPTVYVKYDGLGCKNITSLDEFNRFNSKGGPIIPDNRFPQMKGEESSGLAHNLWYIRSRDVTFYEQLIEIVHRVCGARLDDLHQQLLVINTDIESKLDEIVASTIISKKSKEAIKFQNQFFKFLRNNPDIADADADFILKCLHLDPGSLDSLQKFMWTHKGYMRYVDLDVIKQAQDLAKIAEVHET